MRVPGSPDLEWLRARTAAMQTITPGYIELPGWSADDACGPRRSCPSLSEAIGHAAPRCSPHDACGPRRYCQSLSEAIGQPVAACSLVADDRKTYFNE